MARDIRVFVDQWDGCRGYTVGTVAVVDGCRTVIREVIFAGNGYWCGVQARSFASRLQRKLRDCPDWLASYGWI